MPLLSQAMLLVRRFSIVYNDFLDDKGSDISFMDKGLGL